VLSVEGNKKCAVGSMAEKQLTALQRLRLRKSKSQVDVYNSQKSAMELSSPPPEHEDAESARLSVADDTPEVHDHIENPADKLQVQVQVQVQDQTQTQTQPQTQTQTQDQDQDQTQTQVQVHTVASPRSFATMQKQASMSQLPIRNRAATVLGTVHEYPAVAPPPYEPEVIESAIDKLGEHAAHSRNTTRAKHLMGEYSKIGNVYFNKSVKMKRASKIVTGVLALLAFISVFTVGLLYKNEVHIDYLYGSVCVIVLSGLSIGHNLYDPQTKACSYTHISDICARLHLIMQAGHVAMQKGDRGGLLYIEGEIGRITTELTQSKHPWTAKAQKIMADNRMNVEVVEVHIN
jgi:hypothetical protein